MRDTATGEALPTPLIRRPVAAARERVAAVTERDEVVVLDAHTGATLATLPIASRPEELAISDGGERVVVGFLGRASELWDVAQRHADRGLRRTRSTR